VCGSATVGHGAPPPVVHRALSVASVVQFSGTVPPETSSAAERFIGVPSASGRKVNTPPGDPPRHPLTVRHRPDAVCVFRGCFRPWNGWSTLAPTGSSANS
jgi:hypothetical protein